MYMIDANRNKESTLQAYFSLLEDVLQRNWQYKRQNASQSQIWKWLIFN